MTNNYYDKYWKERSKKTNDFIYKWPVVGKLTPVNSKGSILDIGCGTGEALIEISKSNPQAKITGIDVSKYAIQIISKKLPKHHFYLIKNDNIMPVNSNSADFIICLDVIEHIYDIQNMFREFKRILKPGGKILITTPYYGIIKNLIIVLTCFDTIFNPFEGHIRFFSKKTLIKATRQVNLKILKIGYFGRFYPISNGIYILAQKSKTKQTSGEKVF